MGWGAARMGLFAALLRRKPHERAGYGLYGAAVAAARAPGYFGPGFGVPDTLDGRFDLIGLHAALLIRRLRRDPDPRGPALAQAVFDAMLAVALGRNVWRGEAPGMAGSVPGEAARRLAARALAEDAALAAQPIGVLAEGRVRFLPAPEMDDAPAA
jgi:cytochrome b pre-mRNA-processing protein 3